MQYPSISNKTATDVAFLVKVFPVSRPSTDKTLEPSQWSLRWWLPDSYPLELNQALHMASTTSGILLGSAWFQLVPIFSNALLPTLHLGPKKDLDQCCQSIIFNPYRQRKVQNHVHFPFSLSILVVWNFVKEFQTGSICLHTFLDLLGTSPTIPHGRSPATLENPWVKTPDFSSRQLPAGHPADLKNLTKRHGPNPTVRSEAWNTEITWNKKQLTVYPLESWIPVKCQLRNVPSLL